MYPLLSDERFAVISGEKSTTNIESILLKKVKLLKLGLEVSFEATVYNHDDESYNTVKYSFDSAIRPHKDLVDCFKRLTVHLSLLTEYTGNGQKGLVEAMASADHLIDNMKPMQARSIILKGDDDDVNRGVTITGLRTLQTGKVVNLVTPFVKLDESSTDYNYNTKLEVLLDDIKDEVKLYLGGKQAPSAQQQIQFTDNEPELQKVG